MITIQDFTRLLGKFKSKLALMIGRAVLAAIDNAGKTQKIQVVALYDETITGIERFQEYGLETYPEVGAEVAGLFVNGNRDQGIAICVHDRRYRPKTLQPGEVMIYTKTHAGTVKHCVHMKSDGSVEVDGKTIDLIGGGAVTTAGVVTGQCLCAFTGLPHPDVSTTVKASK